MLKSIPISELTPGMMVTRVIEQNGPVKIRRVGLIKSEAMVKGLTEMGVSVLEVDESQSFTFETEEQDANSSRDEAVPLTPTQRLMEKDKNTSAADRQLSQQFHRSLFMPAIDEMPSKWRLYVRPYALLFGFIIAGFILGFIAISAIMHIPTWLSEEPSTALNTQMQTRSPQAQSAQDLNNETALSSQTALSTANNPSATDIEANAQEPASAATTDTQTLNSSNSSDSSSKSGDSQNNADRIANTESQADETETTRSFESINGIVLNEGEKVLGYGAPEDTNNSSSGVSSEGDSGVLSSDLLNRVNQAAAQIEAEQDLSDEQIEEPRQVDLSQFLQNSAPGPVLDLRRQQDRQQTSPESPATQQKAPVRIDQLPPAILTQMPAMSFSAHMFASNPQDRWVRVNGRRLSEGDFIDDGLSIVEIEPERIVLAFKGETFTMNALSDW